MTHVQSKGSRPATDPLGWSPAEPAAAAAARVRPVRTSLFRRLRTRLFLLLLVAALPLFALELVRGFDARQEALERAERDALMLARSLTAQHRLLVEEGRRGLALLAHVPAVRAGDGGCASDLAATADRLGVLAGISLVRPDLMALCTAGDQPPTREIASATALAALTEGRFATGGVQPAVAGDRPLVPVAQPVAGPDGAVRSVLAGLLDPVWLTPRLSDLLHDHNRLILVTDATGRVVASVPEQPDLAGTQLPPLAATADGGTAERVIPHISFGGRDSILAVAGREDGLAVAVAADRDSAVAEADRDLATGLGWLALVLLTGVVAAHLIANTMLVQPVRRLTASTRTLSRGDPPPRLGPPYAGVEELAELSRAFDELSDRLASREAALITSETQLSVKRQSEERYRALVELAPEAILVQARGTLLYANSKAVALFGAERLEDLLARPVIDLIHPDDRETASRLMVDGGATGGSVDVAEVRIARLDGRAVHVEVVAAAVTFGGRAARHIIVRDITDSRHALDRLRESEERFRALVEASPDIILAHDHGRIVLANSKAARLLFGAADGAAVVGRSVIDVISPADRPRSEARMIDFYAAPRAMPSTDIRLRKAEGGEMVCETRTVPVVFEGRLCVYTVLRDVTARRAEQVSVAQAAKLATLGELAAGMAHELAQPMNIIRMAAEAALIGLETGRGSGGPDADRERLEMIAGQAGRMGEIIDHMRVFTRRDDGPEERFDAADAARGAFQLIAHGLKADAIEGRLELPPDGTARVRGRSVQLEQVILNLLTNARDALRERRAAGAPAAWTPTVSVRCTVADGAVVIAVSDTGSGVPTALRDRLFEPFVTSKAAGVGTGLGLSISANLIRDMGGAIRLDETPVGGGARFVITLPLDDEDDALGRPGAAAPMRPPVAVPLFSVVDPAGGPEEDEDDDEEASALVAHVLVADDEPEAARLMADFLRAQGHRVSVAGNGDEALRLFMRDPADVLVTDLRMPDCDGHTLIRRLRAHVEDLPVVVVTGHVGEAEARGLQADDDVAAVLRKPVGLKDLGRLVDTLFNQDAA